MFILGLTGSIGMGKTTAAKFFRCNKIPVYNSDDVVHQILGKNGIAVKPVGEVFQGVISGNQVDRNALGKRVFSDTKALSVLEKILHPMVRARQKEFLMTAAKSRISLVVLEIPLLFETGGEINCDAVAVVSAPQHLQKTRVMSRPRMTEKKFRAISSRQLEDHEKRRLADFIIPTGLGKRTSLRAIKNIVRAVTGIKGTAWSPESKRHMKIVRSDLCEK